MSVSHLYQNFHGRLSTPKDAATSTDEALDDARLDSFEAGYQAGWDDAVKAQGDTDAKLTEEFVQSIQDMSFTYHEAYRKLSVGMKPVMAAIVTTLLPKVAEQAVGLQIMDQLTELMANESNTLLEIAVAPEKRQLVEQLLSNQVAVPFTVTEETALSSGQIYLRAADAEREINLDAVFEGISTAIDAFFHTAEQETNHG